MKKKIMILIVLLFLSAKVVCFAAAPTFADISWDDGNKIIIAKINTIQGFKNLSPQETLTSAPFWLCSPQMGISRAMDIQPKGFTTNNDDAAVIDIETQIFVSPEVKNSLRSIDFSRSKVTDKLLMINIVFNEKIDAFHRICDSTVDRLLKKYGLPSRIVRDTYQWIISDIEIDFDCSKGTVSYSHLTRINEHCKLKSAKHEPMTEAQNIDSGKLF